MEDGFWSQALLWLIAGMSALGALLTTLAFWSLGRSGHDLAGRSVRVQVDGAGQGNWHWGLGSGEAPSARKKPDATIVGRAPQLALVAGQRLKPDDVLFSGNVVLGGDRLLADTVLRHLRAFP